MTIFHKTAFFALVFYGVILQENCTKDENEYFEVITAQPLVDQLAASYAKRKQSIRGKVTAIAPTIRKNICASTPEEKTAFCKRILRVDYYGFKLDLSQFKITKCQKDTFRAKFPEKPADHTQFSLLMYVCPPLFYYDLETTAKIFLPYVYNVSKGKQHDSAIVFFQTERGATKYPQKYVKRINFEKLSSDEPDDKRPAGTRKSRTEFVKHALEESLMEYLKTKRTKEVYTKFATLYLSLNVCSLPRSHKVYLCRENVKRFGSGDIKLDLRGYDGEKCRKHRVDMNLALRNREPNLRRDIFVVLCPTYALSQNPEEIALMSYYLASNLRRKSVTIFTRNNKKGEPLEWANRAIHLDTHPIIEDIRRQKFLLHPSSADRNRQLHRKIWTDVEKKINSARSSVQMPSTIARTASESTQAKSNAVKLLHFIRDGQLTADFLVQFSRIKKMKLVYKKFKQLYFSLNLCGFRRSHKIYLCRKNLKEYFNIWSIDIEGYEDVICKKRRFRYTRKIGKHSKMPEHYFLLCPPASRENTLQSVKTPTLHYFTSSWIPNSIIAFSRINKKNKRLLPERIIHNFNVQPIIEDIRREKFMLYSYFKEKQPRQLSQKKKKREIVKKIMSHGSVQMPSTIARQKQLSFNAISQTTNKHSLRLTYNRWKVENLLILFAKVKVNRFVYRRFILTYWSLDVCQLSASQRRDLCNDIFIDHMHQKGVISPNSRIDYSCKRRTVALFVREADYLQTNIFATWKCPFSLTLSDYTYYIGKSHLRDAAFVYRSFEFHPMFSESSKIHVDAFVTRINRQLLAGINTRNSIENLNDES